jgi:transcriptional regulator with XRE-family HTH domain
MKVSTKIKDPQTLGLILQQGRLLKNLSQRQLAVQMGLSQKWIWEMEQGKPGLLTERLFKILETTGVALSAEIDIPDKRANETAAKNE